MVYSIVLSVRLLITSIIIVNIYSFINILQLGIQILHPSYSVAFVVCFSGVTTVGVLTLAAGSFAEVHLMVFHSSLI